MKKKSYVGRLGALALMLTVITTCLLGGTMARYVTEVTGSATATVAAWSFKANNNGNNTTFATIDLGDTTNRTSYDGKTLKEGVIAPGTSGNFTITIDGTGSDVGIDYDVDIKASTTAPSGGTTLPDDLMFSTEKITAQNKGVTLGSLTMPTGTIDYSTATDAMKKDVTIYWAWDLGKDDTTTSSNDNDYAGQTWTLDIAVTGKQVAPKESTAP